MPNEEHGNIYYRWYKGLPYLILNPLGKTLRREVSIAAVRRLLDPNVSVLCTSKIYWYIPLAFGPKCYKGRSEK